jgi:hypothetical protein
MSGTALSLQGYKLTFDDEFNTLNAGLPGTPGITWETEPFWGGDPSGGAQGALNPTPPGQPGSLYSVSNGVLDMHVGSNSVPYLDTNPNGVPGGFSQQYGYFEMNAKLVAGTGFADAFWMMPNSGPWPPEIDIEEHHGSSPNEADFTNHGDQNGTGATTEFLDDYNLPDLSQGFHTYGLMWTPTTLTWYFDGQAMYSGPTNAQTEQQAFNMILSAYANQQATWLPAVTPGTSADMYVNWVHAYSIDPNAKEIAGQAGYQDHDGSASLGATSTTGGTSSGSGGTPAPNVNYITPGAGSFTDAAGNVYTLSSTDVAMENGQAMNGGGGTGAMEYANGNV